MPILIVEVASPSPRTHCLLRHWRAGCSGEPLATNTSLAAPPESRLKWRAPRHRHIACCATGKPVEVARPSPQTHYLLRHPTASCTATPGGTYGSCLPPIGFQQSLHLLNFLASHFDTCFSAWRFGNLQSRLLRCCSRAILRNGICPLKRQFALCFLVSLDQFADVADRAGDDSPFALVFKFVYQELPAMGKGFLDPFRKIR